MKNLKASEVKQALRNELGNVRVDNFKELVQIGKTQGIELMVITAKKQMIDVVSKNVAQLSVAHDTMATVSTVMMECLINSKNTEESAKYSQKLAIANKGLVKTDKLSKSTVESIGEVDLRPITFKCKSVKEANNLVLLIENMGKIKAVKSNKSSHKMVEVQPNLFEKQYQFSKVTVYMEKLTKAQEDEVLAFLNIGQ